MRYKGEEIVMKHDSKFRNDCIIQIPHPILSDRDEQISK